ncbi:MAG: YIP1 family protein [Candidatus Micrarchaeota archaeon]|nr:YIP1 family protein [Candidatus Micrarchaeota archaeon]MDE1824082.1 YIP1 family protein [Candidatus Micrarchaeota archaeon]MDE1849351.1 YIP1 family protein [Candidatus Micrarchaeota archaeon]
MSVTNDLKFLWNLVWDPEKGSKKSFDFGGAVKLYYTLAVFAFIAYVVVGSIAAYFGISVNQGTSFPASALLSLVRAVSYVALFWKGLVMFFVILPLSIAIDAFIYQLVGKTFLNMWKGTYDKTFTALVFSLFPLLLLYWLSVIPVFDALFIILAPIWSLIVLVIALSVQQKIRRLDALAVVILKSFLVLFVLVLVGLSLLSAVAYVLGSVAHNGILSFPWHNVTNAWRTMMNGTV